MMALVDHTQPRLRGWHFILFNLVLGLAHMVVLFNAGSYVALLPHAAGDLGGVLPSFGTWAQTDFMIALALAFPLARWLSCRYGEQRVFVAAFVVYAAASALCAIDGSIAAFVPARILLGLAGGVTLPLSQSLLLQEYPDRVKSLGLAIWGLFTLMPFTVGLGAGGWLADHWGWRALFYLNIPVALLIAALTAALLHGRSHVVRCERFDLVGFLLLAVIFGGLQTMLNEGNDYDWFDDPFLRGMLVLVIVAVPVWIVWELGERRPAVDLRLFAHRNFAVGLLCLGLGFLSIQGLLALFVVQLQVLMGYSSELAGLVFVPMMLLGLPTIAVMHDVAKRLDVRWLACVNGLGFAATFYWIGLFDDPHSYDQIFWPMVLEGVFLGSFFTPLTVLTLHGLSGEQMLRAAEAANIFRIAAGALGISWQGVVVFRRMPFHHLQLSDHFGGRMSASYDALHQLTSKLQALGFDPAMIQRQLQLAIKQEAGILALNDAFLLSSALCMVLAVLVWFAHSSRVPALKPAEAVRELQAEELMEQP
ncbi:DHA2 family efflux MFS transporter permease subunit [Nitrospira moscoviensis]|uniref:Putative Multidrug resistance protein B n=1 Tax=Nitrospira moscoviensis TaxID=42253 RepID=A0A0K2GF89_NITMO|nr:DHA2 family efflux MFS transporter permease subunit [Nitrospira moscoviensis]ALA59623.1 putative Multidrug resistance protein B [Nitrospira moscoviensis]